MQLFVFKIGKIKLQNNNLENYLKKNYNLEYRVKA